VKAREFKSGSGSAHADKRFLRRSRAGTPTLVGHFDGSESGPKSCAIGQVLDQAMHHSYIRRMSRQVNLYEAKTRLSQLVDEAARGDEIVIAKNGKAMARLVTALPQKSSRRRFGQWARLLTPGELAQFRSDEWQKEWKSADREIERDFAVALQTNCEGEKPEWPAISSTRTPSSGSRRTRGKSARKRSRN
jgi:prevent-host-death family protein